MRLIEIPVGADLIIDIERSGVYFTLNSRLYDIKGDGIILYPPFNKAGQIQELYPRDIITIRLIRYGKILQWDITTKDIIQEDGIEFLYLETTQTAKNGNRRGAYRVPFSAKLAIKNIRKLNEHVVKSRDLSQTGLSFYSSLVFPKGELYDLEIKDEDISIPLRIKLIRVLEEGNSYVYGGSIIKSDQLLRKYITKKQQEQIRLHT